MTVELLQTLSLVAFIIAGVLLLVSIALFFLLDVPKLYGDVSGRTAKKAIEAIRQQNETSGNKAYKPSAVNAARGKLTDKISENGEIIAAVGGSGVGVGTEKFATGQLAPEFNETTLLSTTGNETTILVGEDYNLTKPAAASSCFSVDVEMSFTGSSEIIE